MAVLTDSKLSGFIGIKELPALWGLSHACRVNADVRQTDGNTFPSQGYQSFFIFCGRFS